MMKSLFPTFDKNATSLHRGSTWNRVAGEFGKSVPRATLDRWICHRIQLRQATIHCLDKQLRDFELRHKALLHPFQPGTLRERIAAASAAREEAERRKEENSRLNHPPPRRKARPNQPL